MIDTVGSNPSTHCALSALSSPIRRYRMSRTYAIAVLTRAIVMIRCIRFYPHQCKKTFPWKQRLVKLLTGERPIFRFAICRYLSGICSTNDMLLIYAMLTIRKWIPWMLQMIPGGRCLPTPDKVGDHPIDYRTMAR